MKKFPFLKGGTHLNRILVFLLFAAKLLASALDPATDFYQHIRNIRHPTKEEMQILQYKLSHTYRPILDRMPETGYIPREFRLISETPGEEEVYERIALRCSDNDKKNCILIYASFNDRYPLGVWRLVEALKNSDYAGHVIFRIGGWPNIAQGDLKLAHVPFAFKPCFFKEAEQLGYQRILWLDSSVLPAPGLSLNWILDAVHSMGVWIQANDHTIEKYMNEDSAQAFGITMSDTKWILS
jgi:ribosomal protein S8